MASPHIAGLLAYFLSLAPSKDSAFAVADLTPEKLKKAMISVASPGVISGLPAETVNLLAWNGGGTSNITEIFGDDNKHHKLTYADASDDLLDRIEEYVEDEVKAIFDKARKITA